MAKKTNHIQSAMRYHKIVFLIMSCLVVLGFYSMTQMNKDEFPQFTIRQGVVAAVYPGASAQEVEEQVTKPLPTRRLTRRKPVRYPKTVLFISLPNCAPA